MKSTTERFRTFIDAFMAWGAGDPVGVPASDELPSPWHVWTFLGLVRFRERQYWVAEVIRERLSGDLGRLATMGALGHPEQQPSSGIVPGLPEWEYRFHGRGCQLIRRSDGLEIDVDFADDGAEFIDSYFYRKHLKSIREASPLERRVLDLHPGIDTIEVSLIALHEAGILVGDSADRFTLSPEIVARAGSLAKTIRCWELQAAADQGNPLVQWLASGDRGAREREERREELVTRMSGAALLGLAELNVPDLDKHIQQALQSGAGLSTAVELASESDNPKWCDDLFAVLVRDDPGNLSVVRTRCMQFLFHHSHQIQALRASLSREWGFMAGEIALIAMEHAPDLALPLIRKALRSSIPMSRDQMAAILALVDRPWSRRELIAVLQESHDHHLTAAARSGLRRSHDPQAAEAVTLWDATHYRAPVEGRFIKIDEALLKQSDDLIGWQMEDYHDRVMKIRDVEPS